MSQGPLTDTCNLESGEGHVTSAPRYQSVKSLSNQLAAIAMDSAQHDFDDR